MVFEQCRGFVSLSTLSEKASKRSRHRKSQNLRQSRQQSNRLDILSVTMGRPQAAQYRNPTALRSITGGYSSLNFDSLLMAKYVSSLQRNFERLYFSEETSTRRRSLDINCMALQIMAGYSDADQFDVKHIPSQLNRWQVFKGVLA